MAQLGRRPIEHDIATALTGPRPHINHPISRHHHGWVVLHHNQGVTGITQAHHGLCDSVHITGVQANAGLIQHKQGIDQRGAQRCREVDPLDLTTG